MGSTASKKLRELAVVPIFAVMLSGLYDDPILSSYVKQGLDIYIAAMALLLKTEKLKDASLTPTERQKWNENSVEGEFHDERDNVKE